MRGTNQITVNEQRHITLNIERNSESIVLREVANQHGTTNLELTIGDHDAPFEWHLLERVGAAESDAITSDAHRIIRQIGELVGDLAVIAVHVAKTPITVG